MKYFTKTAYDTFSTQINKKKGITLTNANWTRRGRKYIDSTINTIRDKTLPGEKGSLYINFSQNDSDYGLDEDGYKNGKRYKGSLEGARKFLDENYDPSKGSFGSINYETSNKKTWLKRKLFKPKSP